MVQSPGDALWAGVRRSNAVVFVDVSLDDGAEELEERMLFEVFARTCPRTAENFRLLCTGERADSSIPGLRLHYKGCSLRRASLGKPQPPPPPPPTRPGLETEDAAEVLIESQPPVIDSAAYALPVKTMNEQADWSQVRSAAVECIECGALQWNNVLPGSSEDAIGEVRAEEFRECAVSAFGDPFELETGCAKDDCAGLLVVVPDERGLCNSRFAITLQDCSGLEDELCVFGRLLAGHGFLRHLDESIRSGGRAAIADCGQVDLGCDGTKVGRDGDPFPAFPEDSGGWLPQRAALTRLSVSLQIKEFGNEAFRDGAFGEAARKYRKALRYLAIEQEWMREDPVGATEAAAQLRPARRPLLLNLAAAQLKLGRGREAIRAIEEFQDVDDPRSGKLQDLKALYRRGLAHCQVHEFEAGVRDLERALAMAAAAGGDGGAEAPAIRRELAKARMRLEARRRRERAAMAQAIVDSDPHG